MTQDERNTLDRKILKLSYGKIATLILCTLSLLIAAGKFYTGIIQAISQNNTTNAVQDIRIGNVEKIAEQHTVLIDNLRNQNSK